MEESNTFDSGSPDKDDQIFEITDFTTATNWERFIADLEELLRKWDTLKEPQESIQGGPGSGEISVTASLKFYKALLITRLYSYPSVDGNVSDNEKSSNESEKHFDDSGDKLNVFKDILSNHNDFPHRAHCIYRWFGVRKFIVITPMENDLITNEDRAKLLLSSAAIAMSNTNVYIPVFVQIHHPQRKFFHGILETSTSRTMFDMIHFKEITENYRYLSELTNLFREKIACPLKERLSIEVSIRFTHILKEWPQEWLSSSIEEENDLEERLYSLNKLPLLLIECPAAVNPIDELHLSATWSGLSEEVINDTPNHSNLDSRAAPYWSARALFKDKFTPTLVHSIANLVNLTKSSKYADQAMGKFSGSQEDKEIEAKAALDKLVTIGPPSLNLPQFRPAPTWFLSEDLKDQIISYIFSKAKNTIEPISGLLKDHRSFKSSPFNSLTWRLSILFHQFKDFASIAYLWTEIVAELRNHWENLIELPRIETDSPDLGTCFLNQKLQMLNCCIQQKKKREATCNQGIDRKSDLTLSNVDTKGDADDDEEQFFDAVDDENELEGKRAYQPEGRSHQLNNLCLLESDEPLYVPITQEPAPMTEDMMMEQVQILAQLGTSSQGAALRARMQSAHLISDMEAFKAANPGAVLEDFVRWHSPRDFIQDDEPDKAMLSGIKHCRGQLSARMQTPGNMWREVWDAARPVPIYRQKLLFDYTKEAEKILHHFASLNLINLIDYCLPNLIHCATGQLVKRRDVLGLTDSHLSVNMADVARFCSIGDYDKCLQILGDMEAKLIKLESLKKLFNIAHNASDEDDGLFSWGQISSFALGLVKECDMEVPGASTGYLARLLVSLFNEARQIVYEERTSVGERYRELHDRSLSPPVAKEYILKSTCPRPSITSKPLPQRMFALITPNEFRVSGAFSQDTLFR